MQNNVYETTIEKIIINEIFSNRKKKVGECAEGSEIRANDPIGRIKH